LRSSDEQVEVLDARVEELDDRVEELGERVEEVDGRVEELDERVEERQACYSYRRWPTGRASTARSLLAPCCRQNRARETLGRSICRGEDRVGEGREAENCLRSRDIV
jgi:predicted RNase H-like nuclease (RuvC/YqgF family)